MTRDEFIDGYMERSKLRPEMRAPYGYVWPDGKKVYALPCACGDDICEGWAMISGEYVEDHNKFYAPRRADPGN